MFLHRVFTGIGRNFWYGHFNIWSVLLMVGLAVGTIALVYWIFKKSKVNRSNIDYMDKLKERYIMGDITEEEYIKKKKILNE